MSGCICSGKLINFELSRSEWKLLRTGNGERGTRDENTPHPSLSLGERAGEGKIKDLRDAILTFYDSSLVVDFQRFYEVAIKREAVFKEKLF